MNGDPGETRTLGPLIKSQLLYQLSYGVCAFGRRNLQHLKGFFFYLLK
jgi:hypothetical protein